MALLMIDLTEENVHLLEFNISDFALNDEINTGTKNIYSIPAGEFCVQCIRYVIERKMSNYKTKTSQCISYG